MNKIEIMGFTIEFNFEDETIKTLTKTDIEHIRGLLAEGYNEGELNHGENEIRGWWKKADEEALSDGQLLDLLYAELDKEQSTEEMGRNMAELLTAHRQ